MKTKIVKVIALCLTFIILCCPILNVSAASYSSNYQNWSQGASNYSWMRAYGCFIVAEAKLIYESGINNSSSFNPDVLYQWKVNNGYSNGPNIPKQYATYLGKTLNYLGKTTSSMESKIWSNISNGYYTLICVKTSSGGEHYVMIANALSSAKGVLYCYNSSTNSTTASPTTISSKGYTITDVYTYSTGSAADNVSVVNVQNGKTDVITDTNAMLYGTVYKPSSYSITEFGIRIRKSNDTYANGKTYKHEPTDSNNNYIGISCILLSYDINDEVKLTLTHTTSYTYQLFCVVNGVEYSSKEATFTTTGSHSYGGWTTTKAATCIVSGSKTRKCSGCSNTETQTIAPLGHNYSSEWVIDKAATCTTAGSKSHHCTRCSFTKDNTTIAAEGHTWGEWKTTKKATLTATGTAVRKCEKCSVSESRIIAKLSEDGHTHKFGSWQAEKAATCLQDGSEIRRCSICGEKEVHDILAIGHRFGEWQITDATCDENGIRKRSCNVCGEEETVKLEKTGHSLENTTIIKSASTDSVKIIEGTCSHCGETVRDQIPIINDDNGAENNTFKNVCWYIMPIFLILLLATLLIIFIVRKKHGR